jgi:putative ABC transport system substrate-binding protein
MAVLRAVALALSLTAPLAVGAQQPAKPARLRILYGSTPAFDPVSDTSDRAIVQGLRENGYVVGQNVVIEFRSAQDKWDRLPGLVAELVGLNVDVLLTSNEVGVRAARDATRTIPIVMAGATTDPVASGLVASLARPGGNITGVTQGDLAAKRLELLKESLPGLRSVAFFHADPAIPVVAQFIRATQAAANKLGVTLHPVRLRPSDPDTWEQVFQTVRQRGIGAATIHEAPGYETHRERLAELALRYRLPVVFTFRTQAEAGGLMSYAADWEDVFRRAGSLAARILKGATPADLPVEEPTLFQFLINLKTAKALGLTLPPSILARATQLIQ